jgi:flagellar biosynthesis protein FlhA
MLVTRSTGKTNMGEEVLGQLLAKPMALASAAAFLAVLTLTPLPKLPLVALAAGCGTLAFMTNKSQVAATRKLTEERAREKAKPEPAESNLFVDAMELQIGFGLVRMVDKSRGGDLLDRVASMRTQLAQELGLVAPRCRIRDSADLGPNQYAILLRGHEVARGELHLDQLLAINSGLAGERLLGIETREPAFGLTAWWIPPSERDRAERLSYTVVEPTGALATHLTEVIRRHAAELLTRAETHKLVEQLKQRNGPLVEEVIPGLLKLGEVQRVLHGLLRERVPIRDLETILETLGDWAPKSKDPEILTEYARNALARAICAQYKDGAGVIHCVTFDPATEDLIAAAIQRHEGGSTLALPPEQQRRLAELLRQQLELAARSAGGASVVVLCSPQIRAWVRRLIEPALPQTAVLALNEIVRGVDVQAHGVIALDLKRANI